MHTVQSCITASDEGSDFSIYISLSVCGSNAHAAENIHDRWRAALKLVLASPEDAFGESMTVLDEEG